MIRLMGMLTGILITLSLYLLYLNINMQAAPVAPDAEADQATETAQPTPDHAAESLPQLADAENETGTSPPMVMHRQPSPDTSASEAGITAGTREAVFWKPFHSHYSASGFARRMTDATGIQVHVLPADRHQYRVAFNYLDEDDRATKISVIESITGLELAP